MALHLDRRAADVAARVAALADDYLLTEAELGAWLGYHPGTLKRLRRERTGPPWLRVGRKAIRYRKGGVVPWLERCAARGTRRSR